MKKVGLVYDDVFLKHRMPDGHPECADRLVHVMDALRGSDVWDKLIQIKPRKATRIDLAAVHTERHMERMSKLVGYADPDTYLSEGTYEAALYAAGAVIEAVDQCKNGRIERAFCAVRPPGHHAEADRAMGFCIFNNIAVGARYAQKHGFNKVFIVDFDVHHGNGTQHIFDDDDSVYYFSTHQYPHYPGTGTINEKGKGKGLGATSNYPMPAGSGEREYYGIYHDILPGVIKDFDPDIILVSAGYDIHYRDPLSQIRISEEGVGSIVTSILSGKNVPAVFALEGGYDLDALAASVLMTVKQLLSVEFIP